MGNLFSGHSLVKLDEITRQGKKGDVYDFMLLLARD
jgi:hypothetical protein